jgi:LmbE family N-acetylglucosaminyl deacetylase
VKIAVVSPHRGDAAFALGLAIEAWLVQGHAVDVVNCFTRSEFAPYSDAGSLHANDRMSFVTAVRKREDEAWRKLYGAAKLTLTDLNLKDAPIRLHCSPNEVFGRVSDASEKVVAKIRGALERSGAGAIVLPLGLGGHVDHVSARDVAMATGIRALPLAFYEEFPDAMRLDGEGIFEAALSEVAITLQTELEPVFARGVDGDASAIEEAVLRKRRVSWCYDSQIDEKVTTQIAEGCRRYEGRERLWGNAAWRADGMLMPKAI